MAVRVLVVGGGASGVLFAVHLLACDATASAVIVERRAELGAGAAYSTNHPDHLLNVRAANMSAFPDDPGHFARWLQAAAQDRTAAALDPSGFAPRGLYRRYLADLIAPHVASGRLSCRHGEAVALRPIHDGVLLRLKDGSDIAADLAVVATGNEGPSLPEAPWRHDGWSTALPPEISPDAQLAVVGTGLTMVDRVMMLLHAGHRGPIVAVSRHGLEPQSHRAVTEQEIAAADLPFGQPLSVLTAWLRARARAARQQGGDWRGMIDGLRPHTQAIWQSFDPTERRRFLRHARPYWDVHRHRIAPEAAQRLAVARASGQLSILPGRVERFEPLDDVGVRIHVILRGGQVAMTLKAQAVFECRGRSGDVTATENPVLRQLLAEGIARPDPLRLGFDVTQRCAIVARDGTASQRLFALGPVTAGTFWEVVAIPDIRAQAATLAAQLCRYT